MVLESIVTVLQNMWFFPMEVKGLKLCNFRNIVHFLKRILQDVDNAVFWQKALLYFENDPLSPSF